MWNSYCDNSDNAVTHFRLATGRVCAFYPFVCTNYFCHCVNTSKSVIYVPFYVIISFNLGNIRNEFYFRISANAAIDPSIVV